MDRPLSGFLLVEAGEEPMCKARTAAGLLQPKAF
jgi:hypothetical protein